jgi:hypothetical protein
MTLVSFDRDDIRSALRKLQDREREGKSLELTEREVAVCISAIHIANAFERLIVDVLSILGSMTKEGDHETAAVVLGR